MFVIIEGLDRCGKSTLIKKLRTEVLTSHMTICHHSINPPKGQGERWEVAHYIRLAKQFNIMGMTGWNSIADRFHLGMVPYGMKYRDNKFSSFQTVDRFIAKEFGEQVVLIYIEDTIEGIQSRDDGEGLEANAAELAQTKLQFNRAFDASEIKNKLRVNISHVGGFDEMQKTVMEFLNDIRK